LIKSANIAKNRQIFRQQGDYANRHSCFSTSGGLSVSDISMVHGPPLDRPTAA
jgi:hypothetical protein